MRALIVEDEPDIRGMLAAVLTRAGHEVMEAVDGESAVETFRNCDCSIVLLDWMLPRLSGIEVATRIQKIRYAYIIMVTGRAKENVAEAVRVGVRDYIQKPFDPDELLECVDVAEAIVRARCLLTKRFERLGVPIEAVNQYL